jgi:hypothetical protein
MDRIGKRRSTARGVMFFSLLLAAVWMRGGCVVAEHKISLQRHLYKPEMPKDIVSYYSGKTIDLNDFVNNDQKTKRYAYFSTDTRTAYEASVPLDYFVMDCFRDAMWMAGMQVAHFSQFSHIPDLKLIIDRWTEEEFAFSIRIERDGVLKYKNQYRIKTAQVSDPKDFAQKEKNAYATVNQAVVTILRDPGVKAAFK